MVFAQMMADGAVLYRDVWAGRQPGNFVFFLAAGQTFGFTEFGVHLFELLGWLAFSAVLVVLLQPYFVHRAGACLVPLLTVGLYYSGSVPQYLTQAEVLVWVPMFVALWFALHPQGRQPTSVRLLVSGLAGGIVASFKLALLGVAGLFWLMALVAVVRGSRQGVFRRLFSVAAPIAAGLSLPLLGIALWAMAHGLGDLVWWTSFTYPRQALAVSTRSVGDLARGILTFSVAYAPAVALTAYWLIASLRRGWDRLTVALVLWLIGGTALTISQLWHIYHFLLLGFPIGVLGARGFDLLRSRHQPREWRTAVAILVVLSLPVSVVLASKTSLLLAHGLPPARADQSAFRAAISDKYATIPREVSFLQEPDSLPGSIYVFGHPLYLMLSGRAQAIAINGWSVGLWTEEVWARAHGQLVAARPAYIMVEPWIPKLMRERSPRTVEWLAHEYRVLRQDESGTWYLRKAEGQRSGLSSSQL